MKNIDVTSPKNSATGTLKKTPFNSNKYDKPYKETIKNKKVLKKDKIAETTPLLKVVNNAEAKIFIPVNKKLIEKRLNH